MNHSNSINKLITFLFILSLALSLIFVYFAQERVYRRMTFGVLSLGSERFIREISVALIFVTVILNLIDAKSKYLAKLFVAYLLLVIYVSINYLVTGPGIGNLTGLMDIKGVGTWICFGLIFVSFDDHRYALFKKLLIVSVIVISIFVFFNLVKYGIGLFRGQALARYRVFATNLVWIVPYVFLTLKNNKKLMPLRIFAIFIGISTALVTQTRSFLLIYLIVFIFDYFHTEKRTFYMIGGVIVGLLFTYILLNTEALSTSLELLQQRGTNDTRTNQLAAFLSQINFFELIVGTGFESEWDFNGKPYEYLDNQWLLFIWWAGFIPALMYFYLTAVIPFTMLIKKGQDYETKVEAFILIIWTLGCAGLAIYSSMSVDFFFFIICVIQGRLLYKYSMRREY